MVRPLRRLLPVAAMALLTWGTVGAFGSGASEAGREARLEVRNPLDLARANETLVLEDGALRLRLGEVELKRVRVFDDKQAPVLSQAIDGDGDGKPDQVIFQASFGPRQSREFSVKIGEPQVYTRQDFKVYGRFVRERYDDFAWENDRVAHRMYGPALETWMQEPLTSSTIDVWCKRTRRLVINDWYIVDDYHRDHGEGADFYSAGKSRGCGGSGLWNGGRLHGSKNFRSSRVLANGPIRLIFELSYEPWDAGGVQVAETKRISLDAGQHLNRIESRYTLPAGGSLPTWAAGLKKAAKAVTRVDRAGGWQRTWEPVAGEGNGQLGLGLVLDARSVVDAVEAENNLLLVSNGAAIYHAGSAWDKGGDIGSLAEWDRYLEEFTRRQAAPLQIVWP